MVINNATEKMRAGEKGDGSKGCNLKEQAWVYLGEVRSRGRQQKIQRPWDRR